MDFVIVIVALAVLVCVFVAGRQSRNWYTSTHDDDGAIDHVFMPAAHGHERWRKEALAQAAAKYGRPFKDGPSDLPHELIHRQEPRSRNLQEIEVESKRQREAAKLSKVIEDQTNVTRLSGKARG